MRRPPFDFLRYKRNVLACATMWPPIALVGSPHMASGFDMTWLVTRTRPFWMSASYLSSFM